jgi:hypothetical protein
VQQPRDGHLDCHTWLWEAGGSRHSLGRCAMQGLLHCCAMQGLMHCCAMQGLLHCCAMQGLMHCCAMQGLMHCCAMQGLMHCCAQPLACCHTAHRSSKSMAVQAGQCHG